MKSAIGKAGKAGKSGLATFSFSLLENGLDFIVSSLEHLTEAANGGQPEKRHLKYAVLHLCSGIELVFKERLRKEHWSLLFKDAGKADQVAYDIGDFSSVTFQDCQDRLKGICGINFSQHEAQTLKNIRDKRNKIEHFGILDSVQAVTSLTSKVVSFVVDFADQHLDSDSLGAEKHLLSDIRSKLGQCKGYIDQRWKEIGPEVSTSKSAVTCPACQQDAFLIEDLSVKCRFCNHFGKPRDAANDYIEEVLGLSHYETQKDGEMWPLSDCPECGQETLVGCYGTGTDPEFICFGCGELWKGGQLRRCDSCGSPYLPDDEEDMGMCSGCIRYRASG